MPGTLVITPSGATYGASTLDVDEWDEQFQRRWPQSTVIITKSKSVDEMDEVRIVKYGVMFADELEK